jgi:hypothetical protein
MALIMNITLPPNTELKALYPEFSSCQKNDPVVVQDVYIRVSQVLAEKTSMKFDVEYLKTADTNEPFIIKPFFCVPSIEDDAPNFIKQGYEYLKTLPEFVEAIDA